MRHLTGEGDTPYPDLKAGNNHNKRIWWWW